MRKILISTNMYKGSEFGQVLPYLKRFPGQVGVEVFPMFHEECFEKNLRDAMPLLKEVPVSFHGPYYQAEHSAAEGTVEYARTMELLEKTLSYAKELSSKYLVYHHNNCRIIPGEKEDRVRVSCENYYTVKQLCEEAGTQVVVENAGVLERGNRLFDEQEFIDLCRREQYAVLIDIGHAWANGWSLKRVVNALADQIVAYHLHNNDGVHLPAGVKFITEDGHGVQDNATMAKAFAICTQKDITVMSHAEDMEISPWDYRLAEDIETVRNCWLSEYYQTKLHMCHVSTRGALDAIQMAKLRGAPVTCEVTPHHLWFTNDTCDYRVNPPIRTADDVQALVDGIRTGIVDAIATDHAPHSEEDKLKGMAGMVGSETAFGVCYTKLCKQEGLPLEVLVHLMSTRPAEILGLAKGQLEPGYDADMVLVDLDTPYTVDKDKLHSKSHNTPFDGAELYGKVCATIKGGKLTYQAEN